MRREAAITRLGTWGRNLIKGAAVEMAKTPIPRRTNLPVGVLKKTMLEAVSKDTAFDNGSEKTKNWKSPQSEFPDSL
jgi:hypothetical protein